MDLNTLGLSPQQMTALEGHITEATTLATEGFKDYISKENVTKFGQAEGDKVRTEYVKKLSEKEAELVKYRPVIKSESEIALDVRLKALEDKEKEVLGKERLLDITNKLSAQGLPIELGKYLQGQEKYDTEITSLKELFNTLKIDSSFKPNNHNKGAEAITKEQFIAMSYGDRVNLFKSNKDLYERLSK